MTSGKCWRCGQFTNKDNITAFADRTHPGKGVMACIPCALVLRKDGRYRELVKEEEKPDV